MILKKIKKKLKTAMLATDNIKVLFEDNHVIIVLKPPDMLCQADITQDADMLSLIKNYLKIKYKKPGKVFLGLVHRLDRRVGGVMVFAKTSKAAARLAQSMKERNFCKHYLALVAGDTPDTEELVDYLIKIKKKNKTIAKKVSSNSASAQKAILKYRKLHTIKYDNAIFSFLLINLVTGRYNQIRKQLALSGHPIINDFKYGYRGKNFDNRLGLYCCRLAFPHPTQKNIIDIAYYPTDWLWYKLEDENLEEK